MTAPSHEGHIHQINTSFGGVPKRPIAAGTVTAYGIDGDYQTTCAIMADRPLPSASIPLSRSSGSRSRDIPSYPARRARTSRSKASRNPRSFPARGSAWVTPSLSRSPAIPRPARPSPAPSAMATSHASPKSSTPARAASTPVCCAAARFAPASRCGCWPMKRRSSPKQSPRAVDQTSRRRKWLWMPLLRGGHQTKIVAKYSGMCDCPCGQSFPSPLVEPRYTRRPRRHRLA